MLAVAARGLYAKLTFTARVEPSRQAVAIIGVSSDMQEQRRALFKSVGDRLLADLRGAAAGRTDTQVQGRAAENAFREWLKNQLPKRFDVVKGAVLSPREGPTGEMDCLVVDSGQAPAFRQVGGKPDLLPIEGVVASIEINSGSSGTSYVKLMQDAGKLAEVGRLRGMSPLPKPIKLSPLLGEGLNTTDRDLWVSRQHFSGPPLLFIFAESLRGNLRELATRLAIHNRGVSLSESVDGAFILNKGFILHLEPGTGWNVHRLTGFPLGWMQADPSQVLLKLMTIIWNYLWKGPCEFGPEMSGYYADQAYFLEVEQPRVHVLEDTDYLSQTEPGFATFRPP